MGLSALDPGSQKGQRSTAVHIFKNPCISCFVNKSKVNGSFNAFLAISFFNASVYLA